MNWKFHMKQIFSFHFFFIKKIDFFYRRINYRTRLNIKLSYQVVLHMNVINFS